MTRDQRINQEIRRSISQGSASFTLPSGTIELDGPIEIPPGTKNFRLIGRKTRLVRRRRFEGVVRVGAYHDVTVRDLGRYPIVTITHCEAGARTLQAHPNQAPLRPGFYFLHDNLRVLHAENGEGIEVGGEMVEVVSYDGTSRRAHLRQPNGRAYRTSPKLADIGRDVCEDILVEGLEFEGASQAEGHLTNALSCGLVHRLKINDVRVQRINRRGIHVVGCHTFDSDGGIFVGEADDVTPGFGYGLVIAKTRFGNVRGARFGNDLRHGLYVGGGSQDLTFVDVHGSSEEKGGDLDLHGTGERGILFERCKGRLLVGNPSFMYGSEVTARDHDLLGLMVVVNPNSSFTGTRVRNGKIVLVEMTSSPKGLPRSGKPERIILSNCQFEWRDPFQLFARGTDLGVFEARDCTFRRHNDAHALYIMGEGDYLFERCVIEAVAQGKFAIRISAKGRKGNVRLIDTTLRVNGAEAAIDVQDPTWQGKLDLRNTRATGARAGAPLIRGRKL
jgi:hypothetical protein